MSRRQLSDCSVIFLSLSLALAVSLLIVIAGCGTYRSIHVHRIDQLGHFEFRESMPVMSGVVVAAPHGGTDPEIALLAKALSERTGAGLVVAHGFKSKRISVAQPVARTGARDLTRFGSDKRHSVFPELKQLLGEISRGDLDLYVELRSAAPIHESREIKVASSGFTSEEMKEISRLYVAACERIDKPGFFRNFPLSMGPDDTVTRETWGIRHHGVLMFAEKGLSLRIPEAFLRGEYLSSYGAILSVWINEIALLLQTNPRRVPQLKVTLMEFGRFDTVPSRAGPRGIVIGAPHGSYDAFTAEMAGDLALRSGWAAVIARGFTPTETGDGRRINVNRPTERHVSLSEREFETERARKTYERYKASVLTAARGALDLYIDIHQNSGARIEVATVGVSKAQALRVKHAYRAARNRAVGGRPDIAIIDLAIEPLDEIEVGAWAAKSNGILTVAARSLHFELPNSVMSSVRQRRLYTSVLGDLIATLPAVLLAEVH